MRLLPASLTARLIITTVALVAIVSLLVVGTTAIVMRSYLNDRLDDQVNQSLNRATAEFGRNPLGPTQRASRACGTAPPLARGQAAGSLTALFTDGCSSGLIIPSDGIPSSLSDEALKALQSVGPDNTPTTIDVPTLGSYRVAAAEGSTGNVIVQGLPTDDVSRTIASLLRRAVLLALASIVAAAFVARLLVRRQLLPLRKVATTAKEVVSMPLSTGAVGTTVRVPAELTDPATEVGQVGEALNQLLEHMEHALDARHLSEQQARTFLADASHELRTPLATIKGYAELSRRTGRADPDQILSKVESEAGRMSSLVEDMLLLARLDAGREMDQTEVDVTRLLVEAVNDARVVDTERKWTFDVPEEPVTVPGDEQRLHQAVTNLLTNASRHTPPKTAIATRLVVDGDAIRIEVHDDGPGIDPNLLPTLFDRFSRGDSSRTRASGGAGLGLSLVRAIMNGHGGTAKVSSEPGDTTFTLLLPTHRRPTD